MKTGIVMLFNKLLELFQKKSEVWRKAARNRGEKNKYIFKSYLHNNISSFIYVCFSFFIS